MAGKWCMSCPVSFLHLGALMAVRSRCEVLRTLWRAVVPILRGGIGLPFLFEQTSVCSGESGRRGNRPPDFESQYKGTAFGGGSLMVR